MLRFKQVLAFPMYGAALWLVWVLANRPAPTRRACARRRCVVRASRSGSGAQAAAPVRAAAASARSRRCSRSSPRSRRWRCCCARRPSPALARADDAAASRTSPIPPRGSSELRARASPRLRRRDGGVVHHLPGERARRVLERHGARRVRADATSPISSPTGRGATPRSPSSWKPTAATACRSISITPPAPRTPTSCRRS